MVAGLSSNAGKTTVMVALSQQLRKLGLKVACFKCGPDYLDPSYHQRASGRPSYNLDSWLMTRSALIESFDQQVRESSADIALVEGVMGLFDGADAASDQGSSAEIARWLGAKILLVVDASGMARTFAALLNALASDTSADQAGQTDEPQGLQFVGALANRVGSAKHLTLLQDAVKSYDLLRDWVITGLPKAPEVQFPARHLGLVTARDSKTTAESFAALDDLAEQWLPVEPLLSRLRALQSSSQQEALSPRTTPQPGSIGGSSKARIAMAVDDAFHFYYPFNRKALEQAGATLVPFSPLTDKSLPDCDGLWLGGGYPELYAQQLSENHAMREAIRGAYAQKMPIWAECGGFMYLCEELMTTDEQRFAMVGVIEGAVQMGDKLKALGYVTAHCPQDTVLGPKGTKLRGHQFRYSDYVPASSPSPAGKQGAWQVTRKRTGKTEAQGVVSAHMVASYVHVHLASHPEAAASFVATAAAWRERKAHHA